jgi:hypothetical protein
VERANAPLGLFIWVEGAVMIVPLQAVAPIFALPDDHGREVSLWSFKHQRPVVVVFCRPDDSAVLDSFAEHYGAYREVGAQVLGVVPEQPPLSDYPFPVLTDSHSRVARGWVDCLPTVVLLDSFGVLYARMPGPWAGGPEHDQLLGWIKLKELQCPECGVPDWPGP